MTWIRARPWLAAFILSLAINLFLGGALAVSHWRLRVAYSVPYSAFTLLWARHNLPADAAPAVRAAWNAHKDEITPKMQKLFAARNDIADRIAADELDPPGLREALARLRADTEEAQAAMHEALVELADELTPEQRRRMVRRLRRK